MSFYTSLNGLKNAQTDLGVISHNIANAETTGFKKSRTEFADIVVGSAFTNPKLVVGIGAAVESISQNFALGPIEQTGSALDLAINGDGFFTTKNVVTGQTLFTRNGSLTVDGAGFVSDGSGNRLQVFPTDAAGTITSTTPADALIPATNGTDASGNPIEFAGITVGSDGGDGILCGRVERDHRQGRAGQLHRAAGPQADRLIELGDDRHFGRTELWPAEHRPVRVVAIGRTGTLERRHRRGTGQPDHRTAQLPGQRQGHRYRHADLADRDPAADLICLSSPETELWIA